MFFDDFDIDEEIEYDYVETFSQYNSGEIDISELISQISSDYTISTYLIEHEDRLNELQDEFYRFSKVLKTRDQVSYEESIKYFGHVLNSTPIRSVLCRILIPFGILSWSLINGISKGSILLLLKRNFIPFGCENDILNVLNIMIDPPKQSRGYYMNRKIIDQNITRVFDDEEVDEDIETINTKVTNFKVVNQPRISNNRNILKEVETDTENLTSDQLNENLDELLSLF